MSISYSVPDHCVLTMSDAIGQAELEITQRKPELDADCSLRFGGVDKLTMRFQVKEGAMVEMRNPDGSIIRFAVSEMTLVARPKYDPTADTLTLFETGMADAPVVVESLLPS